MQYIIYTLAYLTIGYAISYYFMKRGKYTTASYVATGLIVLLWPLPVALCLIGGVMSIIGMIAYIFGRLVYLMDDKPENPHEALNG
jgi:predicted membrane channel-forming protein YqfA (hemolysin III family)